MDHRDLIRIGTRGSALAVAQARDVARAIERACPQCRAELVTFTTRGDLSAGPLATLGGKGLFTAELEAALRDGRIQLAVHSAKDLPAVMADDLVLAGVPAREDPRDVLVSCRGRDLADLPPGAVVGTGSLRRAAQITALSPGVRVVPVRGNVETRIRKLMEGPQGDGPLDAVILAAAGLKRSGLWEPHKDRIFPLPLEQFIPAAGQGALAVQAAADAAAARAVAGKITDAPSHQALQAERAVVRGLGADCRSCLAVHIRPAGEGWRASGMAARADGGGAVRCEAGAPDAAGAGQALLERLAAVGAGDLLGG